MRIPTAFLPLLLSLPTAVVTAYDPDCGSSSYTGFAIKSSSSCASYVYCQSGDVTSETSCPDGLLFNGGVGRGGICTWPEMVVCEEEDGEDGGAAAATTTTTTTTTTSTSSATTTTTSSTSTNGSSNGNGNGNNALPSPWKQYLDAQSGNYYYHNPDTDVTQWQRPSAATQSNQSSSNGSNNNSNGGNNNSGGNSNNANPNNYYCGQSRTDAAAHCHPCPSGSLLDCEDVTHGCFANVDSCAASSSNNGSGRANSGSAASNNGSANSNEKTLSLSDFAQNQNPTTQTTSTTSTRTNAAPSPSVVTETQAPSLPPWTNAPYASYKGPKRSKTVIGYYASW